MNEEERLRAALHQRFDPVLAEPIPARMHLRPPAWIEFARVAVYIVIGVGVGLAIPFARERTVPVPAAVPVSALPERAARAHRVYSPEVRHPVEVGAAEQEHLVKWLSKRLDHSLHVPVLTEHGFELLGGRLLPGAEGPVAHFMYQDASGRRLTLYVSRKGRKESVTAFRFAQEGPVSVFYWVDADCGYALSGEVGKAELSRVAATVYKQLEE